MWSRSQTDGEKFYTAKIGKLGFIHITNQKTGDNTKGKWIYRIQTCDTFQSNKTYSTMEEAKADAIKSFKRIILLAEKELNDD